MTVTQLTGKQIKDQSIDLTTDVTGVLPPANGGTPQYILLQDQKANNTAGGSWPTANSWLQRNLNTIVHDDTGAVTISSNNFTLPAGTYEIDAISFFYEDASFSACRIRLYNITDSSVTAMGTNAGVGGRPPIHGLSSTQSTCPRVRGKFTVATSTTFRIDMRTNDDVGSTNACGAPLNEGSGTHEIYTEVLLRKTA